MESSDLFIVNWEFWRYSAVFQEFWVLGWCLGWWAMFKVWPRMFYRSGWLRCVLVISIRLVFYVWVESWLGRYRWGFKLDVVCLMSMCSRLAFELVKGYWNPVWGLRFGWWLVYRSGWLSVWVIDVRCYILHIYIYLFILYYYYLILLYTYAHTIIIFYTILSFFIYLPFLPLLSPLYNPHPLPIILFILYVSMVSSSYLYS